MDQAGAQSNALSFTTIPPTLSAISPTQIKPGMQMTLTGSSFGSVPDAVIFNVGNGHSVEVASFISWTDTQIVLTVPNGVAPGTVWVDQNGDQSNTVPFTTISPVLSSISPTQIKPGMQITLTGSSFGTVPDAVIFNVGNGHSVEVASFISWTDTQIVLTVPNGVAPGTVWVDQNGDQSNTVAFTTIPPVLSGISPTQIKPGMTMTLVGSGFGTVADAVIFNVGNGHSVEVASFTSWTDTQIVLTVPNGIAPGTVWVDQYGDQSNTVAFTTIAPTLTSISPTQIKPGMTMTLTGSGFGTVADAVIFNVGNGHSVEVASFTSWTDTQIVLTVPNGIAPGTVWVDQYGDQSNSLAFTTSAPTLTSISPTTINPGIPMTLNGSGFGTVADAVIFNIGNGHTIEVASFTSWSDTKIVLTVPVGIASGTVWVDQNGDQSNSLSYTVITPTISSLSPTSGPAGTPVTISGTNFGSPQGSSTVTFNSKAGTPTSWSNTSIVVPVPSGTTTGPVIVTVNGVPSNGVTFTDTSAPTITSISPTSGKPGTSVTINGSLFGSTKGTSTVTFNGTSATTTNWSATQIVATAPTGVTTGNVVVTVGGVASSGVLFVAAPVISSISPTSGAVTAPVTITGLNFGSPGSGTVTFNGKAATPARWTSTSIIAIVPSGATTGPVVVTVGGTASNGVTFTVTAAPAITSLSPTSGAVGQVVTITGTTFGSTQGTSTVKFNGTPGTPTSWSASSIKVPVPTGATTGNVVVTVSGVASNGVLFTVLTAPSITSLSPTSGPVGTAVTITGTNFGTTQGTSTITFNGKPATPTSWSATQILATVPTGATTGPVVVTVNGVASNGVSFTVNTAPLLTSVSPLQGPVGTVVTIGGTNFGSTQGSSTVTFNGTKGTPSSWSATQIVVPVPSGASTGPIVVTVGGLASNGITFTVFPTPSITSLSPTSGAVGASVTINGTNFGSSQGTSTVTFNGTGAVPTSWTNTKIVTTVPAGATTGPVVVTVNSVASNGVTFTVLSAPTITNVSPGSGAVGQPITITGTNFGTTQGSSTVTFNGTKGTATTWSATQIVVPVPTGATSGNLIVTVSGVVSNAVYFTVLTVPNITSLSPSSGSAGTQVSINGTNFGATQGSNSVTFNGLAASVSTWSATQIVASAPVNVTTGPVVVTVSGVASNGVTFTVLAPTISSLSPTSGGIGATVTITGTNFGSTQGNGTVKFNGTAATVQTWSGTSIVTSVPTGATTGSVVVIASGIASNGVTFTVTTAPGITGLSPTSGGVGTVVTITGSGFGSPQGSSTVTFNGKTATASTWNAGQIVASVPTGASTGSVIVTVNSQASNSQSFTVTQCQTTVSVPQITAQYASYPVLVAVVTPQCVGLGTPTGFVSFANVVGQMLQPCGPPVPLDSNGVATYTCHATWPPNTEAFTMGAAYSGDSVFAPSAGTGPMYINRANSSTVIPGIPSSVQAGNPNNYVVQAALQGGDPILGDDPTGTVDLYDTPPSGSTVSYPGTPLTSANIDATSQFTFVGIILTGAGTHSVSGDYQGDSNYLPSTSNSYQVTVTGLTPQMTATDDPSEYYYSLLSPGLITFSTTVSGSGSTPTGTVSLTYGGTTYASCDLSSGSCSYPYDGNSLPITPDGTDQDQTFNFTMTASYPGDSIYSPATTTVNQTVYCDPYNGTPTDTIYYQDTYDSFYYDWYTAWQEVEDVLTYDCMGNQVADNQTVIDYGDDACEWVDYTTYCDDFGEEWESDEYWCDDFGQDAYHWTDYYDIGPCFAARIHQGGK